MPMKRFERVMPLVGLCAFAAAIWMLQRELTHLHIRRVIQQLEHMPRRALLLASALTACGYLTLAFYDLLGMRYLGRVLPAARTAFVSVIGYTFSNSLGAVVGAAAVRLRLYTARGLSAAEVVKLVLFNSTSFWLGAMTLLGVGFLLSPRQLPALPVHHSVRWPAAMLLIAVAGYLLLCARRRRPLRMGGRELRLPPARLAVAQVCIGALDWTLAATTLYVLLPAHSHPSFGTVLLTFLLAQVLALLSHAPGGMGVFETIMLALLRPAMPMEAAIGALVAYRVIYYLLPLAAGLVLLGVYEVVERRGVTRRAGEVGVR
jgi:uncharacterized membrane protein YbhN (UPF0104 family)